jgi:hypothetical protein
VDGTAEEEETYEYPIASIVAATAARSAPDTAHTQGRPCPASTFEMWNGGWAGFADGRKYEAGFSETADGLEGGLQDSGAV